MAGFSEGDCSFQIRITEGVYNHISTTYEISQSRLSSDLFEKYKTVMVLIANLFLTNLSVVYLSTFDRKDKQPAWRVRNTSKAGAIEVVKYFTDYPLFGGAGAF